MFIWKVIDVWTIWYYEWRWIGGEWWQGGYWGGEWKYYYQDIYGYVPVYVPNRVVETPTAYDIDSIMQYTFDSLSYPLFY